MDIYLLLFLIIIFVGSIISYVYYLNDKTSQLNIIQKGICPSCKESTIEMSDQRGAGCGPKLVTFECSSCGYENSFSIDKGSCGV
jgi:predicted RNA-binding Zn-ribbon protein involved in translation (DUF1610 family)